MAALQPSDLKPYIAALEAAGVPPATSLAAYMHWVFDWNSKINITGAKTPDEFAVKHVADVWKAIQSVEPAEHIVDVGSGGGLPGIPMALMLPGVSVTLVERRKKKASVLSSIVSHLGLDGRVRVVAEPFEVVKGLPKNSEFWFRGFLPGPKLAVYLSESFPNAKLGQLVLMKGPAWTTEKASILTEAKVKQVWRDRFAEATEVDYDLPRDAGTRVLVFV